MRKQLVHFIAQHLDSVADVVDIHTPNTVCAFSGEPITEGVKLTKVIKPATANLADTFRFPSEFVSVATAKCFAASRELRGNLFITETGIEKPMISAKSAQKANRRAWRDLIVNYLDNPMPAVLILTDESKRRLWIDAVVSEGKPIQIFVNNAEMSRNLKLDAETLATALECVQDCLIDGFSKQAIRTSLFTHRDSMMKIGLMETRLKENICVPLRKYTEFSVATMIGSINDKN